MPALGPHLLGRVDPPNDDHVRAYPANLEAPGVNLEVTITPPRVPDYNQKQTPKCVAFSTQRVQTHYYKKGFDAPWLYAQCKKIDGDPTGDGTNLKWACDVLRQHDKQTSKAAKPDPATRIAGNTWCRSVDEIRAAIAKRHPVLLGIPWFEAWFTPEVRHGGESWLQAIPLAGRNAGGHEIGAWDLSDSRQAFGLDNTWGSLWPTRVWIPFATVDALLGMGADAGVLRARSQL